MRQLYNSEYTGIPAYLMDFGFGGFLGYGKGVSVGLVMEELHRWKMYDGCGLMADVELAIAGSIS